MKGPRECNWYVHWEYEDSLPADVDYDGSFPFSRIIDGVRMFPFVIVEGEKYFIASTPAWLNK